jgi:hypothetical protein
MQQTELRVYLPFCSVRAVDAVSEVLRQPSAKMGRRGRSETWCLAALRGGALRLSGACEVG